MIIGVIPCWFGPWKSVGGGDVDAGELVLARLGGGGRLDASGWAAAQPL